jgi:hypothetical protein
LSQPAASIATAISESNVKTNVLRGFIFHMGFYLFVLLFLCVRRVQSGAQSLSKGYRVIVCPKVHEIKMRLVREHVIVHCLDLDSMRPQCADHWVDFASKQDKVAGYRSLTSARRLEVDSSRSTHRRWNLHHPLGDLLAARNGELQNAAIDFSRVTQRLLDLRGVQVDGLLRGRWRCCCRGSANLYTPPGCICPDRPNAASTGFQVAVASSCA